MVISKWFLFRRWVLYRDAVPVFVGMWRGENVRVWVRRMSFPSWYVHVGDLLVGDKLTLHEGLVCAERYFKQVTGRSADISHLIYDPHFKRVCVGNALLLYRSLLKSLWEKIAVERS